MNYDDAVAETWHHLPRHAADDRQLVRALVHYATLAPSSHNTQCWRFRADGGSLVISPDLSRRCPVVDPDDHHLYASLGCAAENVVQAAPAFGRTATVAFDSGGGGGGGCDGDRGVGGGIGGRGGVGGEGGGGGGVGGGGDDASGLRNGAPHGRLRIDLSASDAVPSDLFEAIPRRQCTRAAYDGTPLSVEELELLQAAGTGDGVRVLLTSDPDVAETVVDHVTRGNTEQMRDRAFVRELKRWIRFSDNEAVRTRDGLSGRASGRPSAPRWFAAPLFRLFARTGPANEAYARQIRSAAAVAVLVSETDDPQHWVEAGRSYQRLALQATALGIRNAFVNQPVEDSRRRARFAQALGLDGHRPDLVVLLGRGPELPRSLRRPVDDVLDS